MARQKKVKVEIKKEEPVVEVKTNDEVTELLKTIIRQNQQVIELLTKLKERFV